MYRKLSNNVSTKFVKYFEMHLFSGDAGGGLVFAKTKYNRKKWYLRGIASIGPTNKYTTFTNMAYYEQFISTYEPRYRPL